MKNEISFTVESLLFYTNQVKGPIEQVLFAEKIADHFQLNRITQLARVKFSDSNIHKTLLPAQEQLIETLIVGDVVGGKGRQLLFIRAERTGLFVAKGTLPDRSIEIHNDNKKILLIKTLTKVQVQSLFTYVWDNIGLLNLRPTTKKDWKL